MIELRRYSEAPNPRRLGELLMNPTRVTSESVGSMVDLETFKRAAVQALAGPEKSKADAVMAVELHKALVGRVTSRDAADMRMWHWLAVSYCPNLVWLRWLGEVPSDPEAALTASLRGRFLGPPTLNGVSRNTFARLWWCVEVLYSAEDKYNLVNVVFQKQDLFQAVFERRFGLHAPTAKSFISRFGDAREAEWRAAARRLDYRFGTILLEALDVKEITKLVDAAASPD
jgi:uncharacterized protein DUF6339